MWGFGSNSYTIGGRTIDVNDKISEGGYAFVYQAQDRSTGQIYALKKIICQSAERLELSLREIKIMKSIPESPNIVKIFDSAVVKEKGHNWVLILLEYCPEGTLITLMERYNYKLSLNQVLFIFKQLWIAIQHLHNQDPPIVHRDVKVENVLMSNRKFKFCDFGSASTEEIDLATADRLKLLECEEVFSSETTLMYRPPEMIDLYSRRLINHKVDIWMLGCVIFTLAYAKHPFQDGSQLAIQNGHYSIPDDARFDGKFKSFIKEILVPDPAERPDIVKLLYMVENYERISFGAGQVINAPIKQEKPKARKRAVDRDLTPEELEIEMKKIRDEMDRNPNADFRGKPIARARPAPERPAPQAAPKAQPQASSFDIWGTESVNKQPEQDWANFGTPVKTVTNPPPDQDWANFGAPAAPAQSSVADADFLDFGDFISSNDAPISPQPQQTNLVQQAPVDSAKDSVDLFALQRGHSEPIDIPQALPQMVHSESYQSPGNIFAETTIQKAHSEPEPMDWCAFTNPAPVATTNKTNFLDLI